MTVQKFGPMTWKEKKGDFDRYQAANMEVKNGRITFIGNSERKTYKWARGSTVKWAF